MSAPPSYIPASPATPCMEPAPVETSRQPSMPCLERTGSVICPNPTAQQPQPAMVRRNVSSTDTQNIMDILGELENIGESVHCIRSCAFALTGSREWIFNELAVVQDVCLNICCSLMSVIYVIFFCYMQIRLFNILVCSRAQPARAESDHLPAVGRPDPGGHRERDEGHSVKEQLYH